MLYAQLLTARLTDLQQIMRATLAAATAPPQPGETPEDRACLLMVRLDSNLADLVCGRTLALAADMALATGTLEVDHE